MEKENKFNHNQDWDFYMSNVDDAIGSFFIDLGLREIAPVVGRSNVAWVSITMQNPQENGLSSDEESELLFALEDNVVNDIINECDAIYAGRLTSAGMRQLYFYVGDAEKCQKTVVRSMSKYPSYEFDFGYKEDKKWSAYFDFLFPLPNEIQMIMSGRVIRQLEQQGDNLTKERMVDHWIYFDTEHDMQNYISEIKKQGFKVINSEQDEDKSYVLHVERLDKVDYHSVNDYVLYLWELAGEHNGVYDGWGCNVIKE